MKQFARTMITVVGLAVAAAMSPSIHAQNTTVNHGYNASLGIFDGNTSTITFLSVDITGNGYVLSYQQFGPTRFAAKRVESVTRSPEFKTKSMLRRRVLISKDGPKEENLRRGQFR